MRADTVTFLALSALWPLSAASQPSRGCSIDVQTYSNTSLPVVDLGYTYIRAASFNSTGQYYNFSNIRYGQAPVGPLRFRAPLEPLYSMTCVIEDGSVGRVCPQSSGNWSIISSAFASSYIAGTSANFDYEAVKASLPEPPLAISSDPRTTEDCLFLDVIAPQSAFRANATKLPVLIWVYGGGYTSGEKTGYGKFNPAGLLRKADNGFIFVAMNYRMGLFGFLGGSEVANDGTPNVGLYDQRLAFWWVQKHIDLFGGDKNRVTVMGGSAGAGSIMHQITGYGGSDTEEPLFQQAIMQSPAFLPAPTPQTAQATFDDLLPTVNVSSLAQLRSLSSDALVVGNALQIYGHAPYGSNMYGPFVDGSVPTGTPGSLLLQGKFRKGIKIMVSHNSLEGLTFTKPSIETDQDYTDVLTSSFPTLNGTALAAIDTLYPPVFNGSYGYTDEFGRAMMTIQDVTIVCNTRYLANAMRERAYGLKFAVPPGIHGQETNYVFQNGVTSGADASVADRLQGYIVSFIMNSEPRDSNGSPLPLYGSEAELTSMAVSGDTTIRDDAANERLQTAAVISNPGADGRVIIQNDAPVNKPGRNEVLVRLSHSGICGSEIRAVLGWGAYQKIVGHEGVGIIVQTGENVSTSMLNTRVGVKWLYSACGDCSLCRRGCAHNCLKQENTGRTVPGTLQQYVVANVEYVTKIPNGVPSEAAAPLLCAGVTMAGAVSKLEPELREGDWLVISGAGGGLGHIGVQVASRLCKFRVIAIDAGQEKRALSLECGAESFVDYLEDDVEAKVKQLTGGEGAHGILVVPGTKSAFEIAPNLVRNMGVIVCVGLPRLDFQLPLSATVCAARGLTIKGSSVGTEKQIEELLGHAAAGTIKPAIEVFDFSHTPEIIEKLKTGGVTGRAVVNIPS
ncbi:carboxylesterase family protein [Seiridium cupressi]